MFRFLIIALLLLSSSSAHGMLAGGRLNAFSEGQNAFAGTINPANTVWIQDRFDLGVFWVHQRSSITNKDNRPTFPPGKVDFTYRSKNIMTGDAAILKHFDLKLGTSCFDSSISIAAYTTPSVVKLQTKMAIPSFGTTPVVIRNKTEVFSTAFSMKVHENHSLGFSVELYRFCHRRDGFQNSDNPLRSVSPGNVTNRGNDHSNGVGLSVGWRWQITKKLSFGAAWTKKSYCGRYWKYRGYQAHHGKNYIPQLAGAGFSYRFTSRIAGRLEVLWTNLGDLPNANNAVLSNGQLNRNKRGSNNSPGPGLQDATYINMGLGYKINEIASVGAGYSHRIKLRRKGSNFLSHTYILQTIYDLATLGANFNFGRHNLFLGLTYGFKNSQSGIMPAVAGGGRFSGEKQNNSLSFSWGYMY